MAMYGYMRVSTDEQDHAAQRNAISSRYRIDQWIEDKGTGKITQPNLLKLMRDCKTGDTIVVYAFDRLGRNTRAVINIVEGFKALSVSVISIREGLDINSPSGNLVFQMMCSIAEFEVRLIADRVRAGLKAAQARGVKLGRRMLCDDPKKKQALEYAVKLRSSGLSFRKIKKQIYQEKAIKISIGKLHRLLSSSKSSYSE